MRFKAILAVGPKLVVGALAFYFVGGGLDGDGGVPDLDLEVFGIGGHRSWVTHSILPGVVNETGLFSLYDFIVRAHAYLPNPHDPLWDDVRSRLNTWLTSARDGASAGLAFHLGVDATLQPGVYRDLPFSASQDIHNAILGANAIGEGASRNSGGLHADPALSENDQSRDVGAVAMGASVVSLVVALLNW